MWHFIRGLCTVHQQSQYIIDQLDQEFAVVPAVCVRRWIRHCLLAHNLSIQIQALVSSRPYLLQHYLGMKAQLRYGSTASQVVLRVEEMGEYGEVKFIHLVHQVQADTCVARLTPITCSSRILPAFEDAQNTVRWPLACHF